ncbi:MAG: hypothetical protein JXA33_19780 [Anaerolineae bacterium]|nr:hypothetical protein [Anaerolineae bacterium]
MWNMHTQLNQFYDQHIRLGQERQILAEHRDANIARLKAGLEKLDYSSHFEYRNQGSYAMHTLNQHPKKDYDIDIAIIFSRDDLPGSALDTRKRIEQAMLESGDIFSHPPEAKTNAVRVYYAEGHHVDLAIYRWYADNLGNPVYEHAGGEWSCRNPMAITDWFNTTVRERSPSKDLGASVAGNQMRRVVRWLKAFAKSREHWNLPGGLIISTLVAECYRPNFYRDDICLCDTIVAVHDRLCLNEDVKNPMDASQTLTYRPVDRGRVHRFRENLERAIAELSILYRSDCTEEQALKAWWWVFQHSFWDTSESSDECGKRLGEAARIGSVFITPMGGVTTTEPTGHHVKAPISRFYGQEE